MPELDDIDWSRHSKGDPNCPLCVEGYPHPCPCGGLYHGENVHIPDDGYTLLTWCDVCGLPEEG